MARKLMMAGNWKMNMTTSEGVVLTQRISNYYEREWEEFVDIVVCPPSIDLKQVGSVIVFDKRKIGLGAQNVHYQPDGAYTGEISVRMIKEVGCSYCIVGHSERRTIFGETNEDVNKKIKALLEGKISPIVCVGESLGIRDAGTTQEYVCAQVRAAFAGLNAAEALQCIVAYEPIWAIGTGRTATPEQAQEVCAQVRATLADMYDQATADEIRVLYGGSMNPGNVEALIAQPDIDGGLVGGAALKAESFVDLIKACCKY